MRSHPLAPPAAVATSTEQRRQRQRRRWCLPPAYRRTSERSSERPVRFPASKTFSLLAFSVAFGALAAGCGSDRTLDLDLSAAAARGQSVAVDAGCQACHGLNWNGGVGPALVGLAGSTVTLDDDTTVVADEAYLTRAVADPAAQKTKGYTIVMPANSLTADQVADVVAFIQELTPATP
jgi:cytochrome c oxidase subunit 2